MASYLSLSLSFDDKVIADFWTKPLVSELMTTCTKSLIAGSILLQENISQGMEGSGDTNRNVSLNLRN